jgi:cytochrome c oxidase assembly protein subunit 15
MRALTASPAACRRAAAASVAALSLIVVSGAGVRLTQSGLGCPDWPSCTSHRLYAAWQYHAAIEFGNRLVSVAVVVATAVALVAAVRRRPYRRDLVWLAAGAVVGVLAQAVLGGITVLVKLSPPWVMAHFMLSMVVIIDAVLLHHRATGEAGEKRRKVPSEVIWASRVMVGLTAVVLALGTVVTGAGPHSGSSGVTRLGISPRNAAEIHATAVMLLIGACLVALWLLKPGAAPGDIRTRAHWLLGAMAVQSLIGFTQYVLGVPALLVGLHVAGAVLIWLAVLRFHLGLSVRMPAVAHSFGEALGATPGVDGRTLAPA